MSRSIVAIAAVAVWSAACVAQEDEPMGEASEGSSGNSTTTEASTTGGCPDGCGTDPSNGTTGGRETQCGDGADDDGDGRVDCDDTDCQGDPVCGDGTIRIATWNTLRIDPVGSAEHDALVAIVKRLDADILCLEEVGEGEEGALQAVAEAGGYIDGVLAPFTGPPGAGLANTCMSRLATADAAYLWSDWISPDPNARDLTRPFVRVRVEVPGTARFISIVNVHLKAGEQDVDLFRRMVESIRLAQAADAESAQYPNNAVVVMGDLNDTGTPIDATFSMLPAGLPSYYNLGSDIQLPLDYEPAAPLMGAGLTRVEARFEDGEQVETFIPAGVRLDYVWVTGAEVLASEVYEACADDGMDGGGGGVTKSGEPLDCGLSEIASDHRPIVVDLQL